MSNAKEPTDHEAGGEPQGGGVYNFKKIFIVLLIILFFIILFSAYNIIKEKDRDYACYNYHVQECLDCHKDNETYLLCSGFCVEPSAQDLDGKGCPVIHPTKNCFDLPKECNFP